MSELEHDLLANDSIENLPLYFNVLIIVAKFRMW